MDNMVSVEKIKIRDIFAVIGDIFSTSEEVKNSELVNKKLQRVLEVEKEIGATERINAKEKFLEKFTLKSPRRKSIEKINSMEAEVMEVNTKSTIDLGNDDIEIEEELDK